MPQYIINSITITSYHSGPHMSGYHLNHSTGPVPPNIQLLCPKRVIVNKVIMTYNKYTGRMKHVIFSSVGKLLITYVYSTTDMLIAIQMSWHHCHTCCPTLARSLPNRNQPFATVWTSNASFVNKKETISWITSITPSFQGTLIMSEWMFYNSVTNYVIHAPNENLTQIASNRINFLHFMTLLCIMKTCFTNYKYYIKRFNELKTKLYYW